MTKQDRDELLSTYLDGELDGAEQQRLEAQLAENPELQSELDALQRTVEMVRDLPVQPVPRNFILPQSAATRLRPTPAVRPRRRWVAPLLTAVTSLVSLLLVVVLAGDLVLTGSMQMASRGNMDEQKLSAPQPVAEAEGIVVEKEAEEVTAADSAASPLPGTADDSYGETPAPEAPAGTAPTAEPVSSPPPSPTPTGVWKEEAAEADKEAGTEGQERAVTEAPAAAVGAGGDEDVDTPTPAPPAAPPPGAAPTPTPEPTYASLQSVEPTSVPPIPPTPEADKGPVRTGEAGEEAPEPGQEVGHAPRTPMIAWLSPQRILTIALGVTALGLALATVLAWRARRR